MADGWSYYEILGITPNASSEEIARAFVRKGREYANNEEMKLLVTRAYEELRNPKNRENSDISAKYGQRIDEIEEALSKVESREEYIKVTSRLKKVYLELLSEYSTYGPALIRMFRIERILDNDIEAEKYLLRVEQLINTCESEKEKLKLISFLGNGYKEIGKIESAIKMYKQIYEADADCVGEVISLCRLLCEEVKNSKAAIQILNLCINKAKKAESKASYLCETLRIIDGYGEQSYDKVRQTLTKLLKGVISKAEQPGYVVKSVFDAMAEALDEKKVSLFKLLNEVFKSYNLEPMEIKSEKEIKNAVGLMEQMAAVIENGKWHEFMDLYFTKGWTDICRNKMSRLLLKDIDAIQEDINYIKNNAVLFWNDEKERFEDLQNFISEVYAQVKEYQLIKSDTNVSRELREILRILIVDGLVRFETMKTEFEADRDKFFGRQNKTTVKNELYCLELNYPECYKVFSKVFLNGKSTKELFGVVEQSRGEASRINEPETEQEGGAIYGILGAVGAIAFFVNPLIGISILGFDYVLYRKRNEFKGVKTKNTFTDEIQMTSEEEEALKKEYAAICLDKVMNIHLKQMVILLSENSYDVIKQEVEEEKNAFFEELSTGMIRRSLERMELYYPITYKKISFLLRNEEDIPTVVNASNETKNKPGCLTKIFKWIGIIFLFLLIGEMLENWGIL